MTFKDKLKNFWYYHKTFLLIALILIMAAVFAVNSCVNRHSYDLNVLYVSYGYSDSFFQTGELVDLFDGYVDDINGDGKHDSQIVTINYGTTFQETNSAGAQRSANLASGRCLLYLLDERNYQELKSGGFLANISSLGSSEYLTDDAFLAYESGFLDDVSGFKAIDKPYYLCLRTFDEQKAEKDPDFARQYQSAKQTLVNIINQF